MSTYQVGLYEPRQHADLALERFQYRIFDAESGETLALAHDKGTAERLTTLMNTARKGG